ncbi:mechanosensitive ion channel family protein [Ruegeria sp. PrR005]|uniref:Mechanosensitive ion channel family protein n=2 Tax=Ruegeria sp. PrR005 TaxID=2706882 RepID=A0A6B2NYJ2_9RHOB|nr:DUF3772 domain-containing protein [Ruegeria sp. PrR005]NDW47484.1 mechanosensitive ion channel family protein [Ruegeria sp. PrR005]
MMGRVLRLLLTAFLLLTATALSAQLTDESRAYYERWVSTADRAEEVIKANRASQAAFEQLRAEVRTYRDTFNRVRGENSDRIKTLEAQIAALGPKPADGETEAEDIARLRIHLNDQLAKLTVPRIISEEAYSRANGLINEIDRIVRSRDTKELLKRGPSPLNPEYWPDAWKDIKQAITALANEVAFNMRSDVVRERLKTNGPGILLLSLVGLVFLARGRRWSERIGDFLRSLGGEGTGVWSFVVSLLRIAIPWIGVMFVVQSVEMMDITGLRGAMLLDQVPYWAAAILYFNWIGRQVYLFNANTGFRYLSQSQVRVMRLCIDMLALTLVLHDLVVLFERLENIPEATRAVTGFPIILMTALLLLRLQRVRSQAQVKGGTVDGGEAARSGAGFSRMVGFLRRALYLLGIASPLLAVVGYNNAAEALVYPAVKTLALVAVLVILQRFLTNVYGWLTRKGDEAGDSLFSVILGFLLAILALPLLALYWGAREAELIEIWSRIMMGFDIGGVVISPSNFLTFALVFAIGYTVTRLLQGGLRNSLLPKTRLDPGGQNAIVAGTGYLGIFLAALLAITMAGFDLSSLAIVAGALSVGIGFGLQTIVSNFVSGIILLIERPISKGDWIDVNGQMGYVRDISVRSTRIETFDRTDVIIPNSDLISGSVTNYTRGNTVGRVIVPVGVAYGTDTRRVETILREIAEAHPMVLANPAPNVVFQGFGADSLDFEIRAILRDVNWVLSVKSDMNHEINRRFLEEGIEIPFAQRDVWLRNPEALTGAPATTTAAATEAEVESSPSTVPATLTEADMNEGTEDDH